MSIHFDTQAMYVMIFLLGAGIGISWNATSHQITDRQWPNGDDQDAAAFAWWGVTIVVSAILFIAWITHTGISFQGGE